MSYYRENIMWQSADGTWSRGFYAEDYLGCGGNEDECGDETHEWCREFDHTQFDWVSVGHADEAAAFASWNGANPGSADVLRYDPDNPACVAEVAEYEDMAARRYESGRGYSGPPRQRTLAKIKAERDRLVESWASTHVRGYGNLRHDEDEARLDAQLADRLRNATEEERAAYRAAEAAHLERVRELVAESRRRRAEARRYRPWGGAPSSDAAQLDRERELLGYVEAREQQHDHDHDQQQDQQDGHARQRPQTDQGRQPRGTSAGGQYAAKSRGESDVELDSPTDWGDDPWG